MNKMVRISIPSLKARLEDIIPMAVFSLDPSLAKSPKDFFTNDTVNWLKTNYISLTAGNLTAILSNLQFESSKYPYNSSELERAFSRLDIAADYIPIAEHKETAGIEREKRVSIEKKYHEGMLNDFYRETANYVFWAIEENKDKRNNKPNYPKTWFTMTGQNETSSTCQRNIGNIIFQISNEELIPLIRQSESFKEAVFTCGKKVQSAKKRLHEIEKLLKHYE